jgi:hypothetical protein
MFHEGAHRVLASGAHVPALHEGDKKRVALEAYPGLLVRKQLGLRDSYKSDTRAQQTAARRNARRQIVRALLAGKPLGIRLRCGAAMERSFIADGSGDLLDAAICAVQAAWAAGKPNHGIPTNAPAGEGWIITA